jgi:hypothetical protein
MHELFASGRIVDLILGLVAAEASLLCAYHRLTGRGPAHPDLLANLLAGALLLLAVRAALVDASWPVVAAILAAALAAHLWDLRRRWPLQADSTAAHAPGGTIASGTAGAGQARPP